MHIQKNKPIEISKNKKITRYPLLVQGTLNSSYQSVGMTLAAQYIENCEGLIYIDRSGDVNNFVKIYSFCQQFNRPHDLFVTNFLIPSSMLDTYKGYNHTVEPINPMIGNEEYFQQFFGSIGPVIHSILKNIKAKCQIVDFKSLESLLMLPTLIDLNEKESIPELSIYLQSLGKISKNNKKLLHNALLLHDKNCKLAYHTIDTIQKNSHVFSIDCSINIEQIFLKRQIIVAQFQFHMLKDNQKDDLIFDLFLAQIKHIEEKHRNKNTHFQNIILHKTNKWDNFKNWDFIETKNNYVFLENCQTQLPYNFFKSFKSYIFTEGEEDPEHAFSTIVDYVLDDFQELIIEEKVNFLNFSFDKSKLCLGECYFFMKKTKYYNESIFYNYNKFDLNRLKMHYYDFSIPKSIKLVRHKTSTVIEI